MTTPQIPGGQPVQEGSEDWQGPAHTHHFPEAAACAIAGTPRKYVRYINRA